MDYLVRFSQTYETFRLPELQSLATLEGIDMKVVSYKEDVPRSLSLTYRSTTLTTLSSHPSA